MIDIHVGNKKLKSVLEDFGALQKMFGADMAKKVMLRVTTLKSANSLADFWPPKSLPERCHELQGDMAGIFSMDLKHPYRLLFKPIESAPPVDRSNEQLRWQSITAIEIVSIEDTHG